jgi:hypothetical protein
VSFVSVEELVDVEKLLLKPESLDEVEENPVPVDPNESVRGLLITKVTSLSLLSSEKISASACFESLLRFCCLVLVGIIVLSVLSGLGTLHFVRAL